MKKINYAIVTTVLILVITSTLFSQNKPDIPEGTIVKKDLVYAQADGKDLLLDLYLPPSDTLVPLIIWVHGGAWKGGSKNNPRHAVRLIDDGFAIASINYRLSHEAIFPAQIIDCKAAVRWLRAHAREFGLDPKNFGAWGSSAGGHLVALMGTAGNVEPWDVGDNLEYTSRVQAVCDWYGPTDFLRMDDHPGTMTHLRIDSPESKLIGGDIRKNPEKVAAANPITYISKDDPPILLMHGKNDGTVIHQQSILLHKALQEKELVSELVLLDSTGHGGKNWPAQIPTVTDFFNRELRKTRKNLKVWDKRYIYNFYQLPEMVVYKTFTPKSTGKAYGYMLYLPPGYDAKLDQRYPVLYFLPGLGGNPNECWPTVTAIDKAIQDGICPEMIIIGVPAVRASWYCDDASGLFPVETIITQDIIQHVDATYRTMASRDMRMIEGFSMGGQGAARLGFKHVDIYGHVSVLAGAFIDIDGMTSRHADIIEKVFGNNPEAYKKSTPEYIVQKNADQVRQKSHVRINVGKKDGLYKRNIKYHKLLKSLNIKHDYTEIEDTGHSTTKIIQNYPGDYFKFYREAFGKR